MISDNPIQPYTPQQRLDTFERTGKRMQSPDDWLDERGTALDEDEAAAGTYSWSTEKQETSTQKT